MSTMSTLYHAEPELDLEFGLIDGPTPPAYTERDLAVLEERPGEHIDDIPEYVEYDADIMLPVITLPSVAHLHSPSTSSPSTPSNASTPFKLTPKAPCARKTKKTPIESDRTISLCTRALIAVGLCIGVGVLAFTLGALVVPKEDDKLEK